MHGSINAKPGGTRRTGCAGAVCGAATPYPKPVPHLAFTITTTNDAGYTERWQVRDFGSEVRVEPLPARPGHAPIGSASVLADNDAPRRPHYETARDLALQVMEAAGLLNHNHTEHEHQLH